MYEVCTMFCSGKKFSRVTEGNTDYIYNDRGQLLMLSHSDYLNVIDHSEFGPCIQARNKKTGITSWHSFEDAKMFI